MPWTFSYLCIGPSQDNMSTLSRTDPVRKIPIPLPSFLGTHILLCDPAQWKLQTRMKDGLLRKKAGPGVFILICHNALCKFCVERRIKLCKDNEDKGIWSRYVGNPRSCSVPHQEATTTVIGGTVPRAIVSQILSSFIYLTLWHDFLGTTP